MQYYRSLGSIKDGRDLSFLYGYATIFEFPWQRPLRRGKLQIIQAMSKHPDIETLLHYVDGELPAGRRRAIAAHLRVCSRCRIEEQRLQRAKSERPGMAPQKDPQTSAFLANLRKWELARLRPEARGDILRLRVASELAPYLGASAASRILRAVADSGENLLPTITPVLDLFLGKSAASLLVSRIIDRTIMRI
jgi:anti-sigma factor RsiW